MKITETRIPDVKLIEPSVFGDDRGFFMETWNKNTFLEAGINPTFVQDNHSRSVKNTLRGLHYQLPPHAQGKLVRVSRGEVFDVAVDLRPNSSTFGQWVGQYLSETNHHMLWVPPGFAHGFLVISDTADFQYKCTTFYAPDSERSILWSDKAIGIDWGLKDDQQPILSDKDAQGPSLDEATPELIKYG